MKSATEKGFTIVELLIVIVVIGILAAITIVSYNGIQQRALTASLQAEVSQAVTKVEASKASSGSEQYPDAATAGLSNTQATYFYDAKNNTYCIEAKKNKIVYSATNLVPTATSGDCTERGLIGWWQLNNSPNDSSGNSNDGALTGPPTSIVGQDTLADHAYQFANASGSNVNIPHNNALNDFQTISLWVNPTNWTTPTASVFLAKRSGSANGIFLGYVTASSSIAFDCGGQGGGANRLSTSYAPPLNQWSNIVVTCSAVSGVALYANGTLIASRSTVDRSAMVTNPLRFGQDSGGTSFNLNGGMDDIRFYNRVLTPAEITNLNTNGAK